MIVNENEDIYYIYDSERLKFARLKVRITGKKKKKP